MSIPCKFERSLLSHEEYETVRLTHHPAIYDVEVSLRPCDPACARCAIRSERSADKSGEKGAEKARLAERAFQEPPSTHYIASKSSPRR